MEKVAANCLKEGDWLLDHIEGELAFMRARIFVGKLRCAVQHRACERSVLHVGLLLAALTW